MDHRQFQSRCDQRHDLAEVRPTQRTNMSCFLVTSSPYPDAWASAAYVTLSYPVFHHRLGDWCFHLAYLLNTNAREACSRLKQRRGADVFLTKPSIRASACVLKIANGTRPASSAHPCRWGLPIRNDPRSGWLTHETSPDVLRVRQTLTTMA